MYSDIAYREDGAYTEKYKQHCKIAIQKWFKF